MESLPKLTSAFGAMLLLAACAGAADESPPADEPSSAKPKAPPGPFMVTLDGEELRTQFPLLSVSYGDKDEPERMVESGFATPGDPPAVAVGLQLPVSVLTTGKFEAPLVGPVNAAEFGVTVEVRESALKSGRIVITLGKMSEQGTCQLTGKTVGADDQVEFSGPVVVQCSVPLAATNDSSLPQPPVPVDASAGEVLVLDERFASSQCKQLKETLLSR